MADDLIAFNAAGAEQYKKIAREVTRQMKNETPHRARWQQSRGGAVTLAHGVILEQCNAGCSTYRVQRVHRYLKPTCDEASGSGSGS